MFKEAFREMDRMDNFSYQGLDALYEYLEDCSEATGENVELDVVGLCCDFNEETYQDIAENHSIDVADHDDDETKEAVVNYLEDRTCIVYTGAETVLFQEF